MQKALIIVDVLNDFITGSLAVQNSEEILPVIKKMIPDFDVIVFVQDWHPAEHNSFEKNGGRWPAHCVQNTPGAQIHQDLLDYMETNGIQYNIIQKGWNRYVESYSGFFDNQTNSNGLLELLNDKGITDVVITGLATDFCVKATAIDAVANFNKTVVYLPACKFVNNEESNVIDNIKELIEEGVSVINDEFMLKITMLI